MGTMIKGCIRALRAILSSLILVSLMTYIWAIVLHMILKDERDLNDHISENVLWWGLDFSTIPRCMWNLWLNGTLLLDNASPLMSILIFHRKPHICLAGILFVAFVVLTALLIVQMVIGILCDV